MIRFVLALALIGFTAMAQNCNLMMLTGTYAVSYQGTVLIPQQDGTTSTLPGLILGVFSINRDGTFNGGATVNIGGQNAEYAGTGTIDLGRGCVGTITMNMGVKGAGGPLSQEVDRFVFVPTENELHVMQYSFSMPIGAVVLGTWKRISPLPNAAVWDF